MSKTAIQVTLATLDQGTQSFNVPITALQKLGSYYSKLGFLSNVTAGIQNQLNSCITSIPTNFSTLTLNNVSVATTNQLPSMTGVLKQATTLSPVWYSNNRCITLDVSSSNIATLDFHSNDSATSTQLYDARIQVLNGSNSTYGGGSMYIYASGTNFYTPVYLLDSGGIWSVVATALLFRVSVEKLVGIEVMQLFS